MFPDTKKKNLDMHTKTNENLRLHEHLYINIQRSIIHNNQKGNVNLNIN